MKTKFDSNDELGQNKTIQVPSMIIVVKAVFHRNDKYYLLYYPLNYDRSEVSEGIADKTNESKECNIYNY